MDFASETGNIYRLQELLTEGSINYTTFAMTVASKNGYCNVLDWWLTVSKKSGLPLKYDHNAICLASSNGRTDVLNWWVRNIPELKYTHRAMESASEKQRIDVLNWWVELGRRGYQLKYTSNALDNASRNEHLHMMDWWLHSGLPLQYSSYAIDQASSMGSIHVLDWWLSAHRIHGIELKYSFSAFDNACYNGNKAIEWWLKSGLPLRYTICTTTSICKNNKIDQQKILVANNFHFIYNTVTVRMAFVYDNIALLNYLLHQDEEII